MAEKCGLEAFPRELLLRILVLTDIYTVLTISQVNSFFHTLASTKQLWLFLTKDLFLRGLIDIHSDEANLSLSSHELIAQVKRAVRGPRTWAPDSTTAPSLIQRFTIPLELEHSTFCCLLGGQYIVFRAQQSVECYHVSTGRCVWSWGRPDFKVLEVVFSVCRGSKTTAFVTVFNEQVSMHMRLMLLDVDLESGQSREMFQVPSMGIEDMSLKEPQSAEGYLGCVLVAPGDDPSNPVPVWRALLVNLRTEQYIVLDCGLGPRDKLHIIPGYILLLSPQSDPLSVRIHPISSLKQLWRPLSDLSLQNARSASVVALTVVPVGPRNDGSARFGRVDLFLTESLLRQNTYLLRVIDIVTYPKAARTTSIHRLDLFKETPQSTLLSTFTESKDGSMRRSLQVSRAGYSILRSSQEEVCLLRHDDGQTTFIPFDGLPPAILPHNGGLVVLHKAHTEVLYYD